MRRFEHALALHFAALIGAAACGSPDDPDLGDGTQENTGAEAGPWGYSGAHGPEFWGELSEDYALCSDGSHQSPVDFPDTLAASDLHHLEFDYAPSRAHILDNGHTVVVEMAPDAEGAEPNVVMVDGVAYRLLQFHFHAESEHRLEGEGHPLEMHLVHQASGGDLAVVGIFLVEGEENTALSEVFEAMSRSPSEPHPLAREVDLGALLPTDERGWTYSGSLTTPPCSEGVQWNVYAAPLTASAEQIDAFTHAYPNNRRPPLDNADLRGQLSPR